MYDNRNQPLGNVLNELSKVLNINCDRAHEPHGVSFYGEFIAARDPDYREWATPSKAGSRVTLLLGWRFTFVKIRGSTSAIAATKENCPLCISRNGAL